MRFIDDSLVVGVATYRDLIMAVRHDMISINATYHCWAC